MTDLAIVKMLRAVDYHCRPYFTDCRECPLSEATIDCGSYPKSPTNPYSCKTRTYAIDKYFEEHTMDKNEGRIFLPTEIEEAKQYIGKEVEFSDFIVGRSWWIGVLKDVNGGRKPYQMRSEPLVALLRPRHRPGEGE